MTRTQFNSAGQCSGVLTRITGGLRRRAARAVQLAALGLLCQGAVASVAHAHGQNLVVNVEQGRLRGTRDGGVDRFLAVPYAAPPVGALRWQPPEPASDWQGVRAADTPPPSCLQAGSGAGDEDCLYLNIYRPTHRRRSSRLPVLFFIHGGSFGVGSGSDNDPTRIARDTGTLVVMINFRLGKLGFLVHPALAAEAENGLSGMYGVMDQQAALRWVHDNIEAFGGDRERVTIAGGSSGAMSVCAHLASPPVAGLFAGAVMQSGSCRMVTRDQVEPVGIGFAEAVGCPDLQDSACLRDKTAAELATADSLALATGLVWGGPLLPEPPLEAIAAGRAQQVPVLLGGAEHESRAGRRREYPLEESTYITRITNFFGEAATAVLEQYPPEAYADPFYAVTDVISDASLTGIGPCHNREVAQALSVHASTFVYEFADNQAPMPPWVAADVPPDFELGASHGSSEIYWFDRPQDGLVLSEPQQVLADDMVRYLGRFVRRGAPSRRHHHAWPHFDAQHERVLRFEPKAMGVRTDWAGIHKCEFWKGLGF